MKKVIVFLLIIVGLAFLDPRSRAPIMKVIRPVSEATRQRSAQRALKQIALDLERTVARTGAFPQGGLFVHWLKDTQSEPADPWGSAYYLEVFPDSFVVASPGPDSKRHTADDLRLTRRRQPTAAGLGSAYTPPAPVSSGVKSRAIRKAQEIKEK